MGAVSQTAFIMRLVWETSPTIYLSPDEFRSDVIKAKSILEDITGKKDFRIQGSELFNNKEVSLGAWYFG